MRLERRSDMGVSLIHAIPWAVALGALYLSAATDLKERIVPNKFVAVIAASGVALTLAVRPDQLWISLLAAAGVLVGLGVLAHYDLVGGGDVKLISALTLLVPPERIGMLLVGIVLAGGLLGCAYFAARHVLEKRVAEQGDRRAFEPRASSLDRLVRDECARIAAGEPMPYALAVLAGAASYVARELPKCYSAISCSF